MKLYEGIFVFSPQVGPDDRKTQEQSVEALIKKFEGKITERHDWGKRSLGYQIKKFRDGYFWVVNVELPPAKLVEFRKALELHPDLVKFMLTVKNPKLSTLPSARPAPSESDAPGRNYDAPARSYDAPARS
ncbi:MAG TPA: 30S ribosomal protein S6 [Verrucomicrobiae bacterium]|jgi:small subunit ribosomal protein S6|nr:30S ribosomal protein S6 [Verrucomicrobiae bacterium]